MWLVLGVLALLLIVWVLWDSSSCRIDSSVGIELLEDDRANQALLDDNDHRVELTLQEDFVHEDRNLGTQVHFFYSKDRAESVVNEIAAADLDDFTDQPVTSNWLMSMLCFLIPFIFITALLWLLMTRISCVGGL